VKEGTGAHKVEARPTEPLQIKLFCPNHLRVAWQGHIVFGIAQTFYDHGVDIEVWVNSADADARRGYVHEGVPGLLHRVLYKCRQGPVITRMTERRFVRSLKPNDIVYAWPSASVHFLKEIKNRGHCVLLEAINCAPQTCRRIQSQALLAVGVHQEFPDSDADFAEIRSSIGLADGVLTAHRLSTQSYIEFGVSPDRILESSYGWEPKRFGGTGRALPPAEGLTVLFVGTPIVRKGVHLLLEAWDRAKIKGRLVLVGGTPEPLIAERCASFFNRPDVHWLPWLSDVGDYYRSADVFAFPSLEEGGPLVIYEAMGCGLPAIASPMGGGAIGQDGEGIIILDPYDIEAWADAFRRLQADEPYRRELGEQARRAAQSFTWEKASLKRLAQIMTMVKSGT
jgi:glycosyltransferase involved in cell wall biosynthesis